MSSSYNAVAAIEALRSGIPSSTVSELFNSGQDSVHQEFARLMDQKHGSMVVQGEYGQGKTHLLKALVQAAKKRGYVTSLVCLSKETPFNHWWHVYGAAIRAAETPDDARPALNACIGRWRWSNDDAQALYEFAHQHLHPRVAAVLEAYLRANEVQRNAELLADLRGHALRNQHIARLYREVAAQRIKLPAAKLYLTGKDYFAMAGKLFSLAGYTGWAIFFDEFELVGKLSAQARARAYANLGCFLQTAPHPGFDSIVATFTILPSFISEYIVDGRRDIDTAVQRLQAAGLPEDAQRAQFAMRYLAENRVALRNLTVGEIREALAKIAALHSQAYGWQPPEGDFYVPDPSIAQRMRTAVRYAVERLDLAFLYGEVADVRTQEVEGPSIAEDRGLFAGKDAESDQSAWAGEDEVTVVDVDM